MGCHILYDETENLAALFCSTSDWAFGPVFYGTKTEDAREVAEAFLKHIVRDPRDMGEKELEQKYTDFCNRRTLDYEAGRAEHFYELNRGDK